MNRQAIIGVIVILVFTGFALYSFRSNLNPYVSFSEAEAAQPNQTVQVLGYLVEDEPVGYDSETNELQFSLVDEKGTRAQVTSPKTKPAGFEDAESMVVIGKFEGETFHAQDILLKCPSKYQSEGV